MQYLILVMGALILASGCGKDDSAVSGGNTPGGTTVIEANNPPSCPDNSPKPFEYFYPCKSLFTKVPQLFMYDANGKVIKIGGNPGENPVFINLPDGGYTTEDGRNCQYSVVDGKLIED